MGETERKRACSQKRAGSGVSRRAASEGERGRENLLKGSIFVEGRKTTMETPSEENQDQRQNKRGTNEHSQRATSFHCCVYWGFNLLQPAWVDPTQQTDRFLKIKLSIFASAIACAEMLKIQLPASANVDVSIIVFSLFVCLNPPTPQCFAYARFVI